MVSFPRAALKSWFVGGLIFVILWWVPFIPQIKPYEALTEEGGFYGQTIEVESVVSMIKDWDCNLNCFPQNDQTRRWNLISFALALGLCGMVSAGVGWIVGKRFKSKQSRKDGELF